jgi:hypothetical protein
MNEDGHVLKSRRGLLAAGLAVVVVGALGVASTLNAGAEQVPGDQDAAQAPVAQQADATDDVSTPPATLPWGGKPQRAHRGRPGLSSRQLRAQGFQSAPDANGHRIDFAPKGRSNRTSFLKSQDTSIKPPAPAASADATSTATPDSTSPATTSPTTDTVTTPATSSATTAPPAATAPAQPLAASSDPTPNTSPAPSGSASKDPSTRKVNFLYSVGSEAATADGVYVAMDVRKPTLAKGDYHTLAELALQSADTQQTIEVGWTVDRSVNGDEEPHLFVFHWVNNQPTCYNTCGFVPYKGGVSPGDTLPIGNLKMFGIQHNDGAWWIAYDNTFVGYFPDREWSSQGVDFTKGGFFQAFGEVAASSTSPCTQMGSGYASTDSANAARMGNFTYVNNPATANLYMRSTNDTYGMTPVKGSTRAFWYGGPGSSNC